MKKYLSKISTRIGTFRGLIVWILTGILFYLISYVMVPFVILNALGKSASFIKWCDFCYSFLPKPGFRPSPADGSWHWGRLGKAWKFKSILYLFTCHQTALILSCAVLVISPLLIPVLLLGSDGTFNYGIDDLYRFTPKTGYWKDRERIS